MQVLKEKRPRSVRAIPIVVVALLATVLAGGARASLFSQVGIGTTNSQNASPYSVYDLAFDDESGAPASTTATQSFTGQDGNDNTQTMTFTGNGSASATYGQLHASSDGTVTNTYYNVNNPVYYDDGTNTVNPNGSPDGLASLSFAGFSDTLHFSGTSPGDQVQFLFHLDGTNSGDGSEAAIAVTADNNSLVNVADSDPVVSRDITSQSYGIDDATPLNLYVQLLAQFYVHTSDYPDGSIVGGTANFSQTFTLEQVAIVDANGDPVSGASVSSDSGTQYPTSVPEPASVGLLMMGAIGMLSRRRKR